MDPFGSKVCENEGQKKLISMKKGVNWTEKYGENLYKMLKINQFF